MCHTVGMATIFVPWFRCNGWMLALTWNAGNKREPAELRGLVQKQMNVGVTARKNEPNEQFAENLNLIGFVA